MNRQIELYIRSDETAFIRRMSPPASVTNINTAIQLNNSIQSTAALRNHKKHMLAEQKKLLHAADGSTEVEKSRWSSRQSFSLTMNELFSRALQERYAIQAKLEGRCKAVTEEKA